MMDASRQDAEWKKLVDERFRTPGAVPFHEQWALWQRVFADRPASTPPPAATWPDAPVVERANVTRLAKMAGVADYPSLHAWSAAHRDAFWSLALEDLAVPFRTPPTRAHDGDAEHGRWLPGARMNATDLCFRAPPTRSAIVLGREGHDELTRVTYAELKTLVDRVANGFAKLGLVPGDAVSLYLPMTVECVAAYLGIVRAGGVVVSIADSFAPPEVATRNALGRAKAIVTTGAFTRGGKTLDLYAKVRDAQSPRAIVIGGKTERAGDVAWVDFLGEAAPSAGATCDPYDVTNVLFSSGTTGEPKAIPWTHLTPLKAAMDGRYHQDIHEDDIVAWPTSIGWMMGPWLIYATLANGATMALFEGAPNSPEFPRFIERSGATILGVVPAIVRAWRAADSVGARFAGVRVFSSTGEASNVEDSLWLASTAGYRAPIIEYCGGTEIGGGHLTGVVVQPQSPATFSTPALGLDFVVLDAHGKPVHEREMGEIWLVPPSIGLSQRLLNRDHHKEYFDGAPRGPHGQALRRHGDEVERLPGGYWRAHGRADDTMNLGGIKVSSLELERAMDRHPRVYQTAAVAIVPPAGGADELVVFAVLKGGSGGVPTIDRHALRHELQEILKRELNPLYRIADLMLVDALPRTASNKIMRRELRKQYKK